VRREKYPITARTAATSWTKNRSFVTTDATNDGDQQQQEQSKEQHVDLLR
jgi:hypothetical protein